MSSESTGEEGFKGFGSSILNLLGKNSPKSKRRSSDSDNPLRDSSDSSRNEKSNHDVSSLSESQLRALVGFFLKGPTEIPEAGNVQESSTLMEWWLTWCTEGIRKASESSADISMPSMASLNHGPHSSSPAYNLTNQLPPSTASTINKHTPEEESNIVSQITSSFSQAKRYQFPILGATQAQSHYGSTISSFHNPINPNAPLETVILYLGSDNHVHCMSSVNLLDWRHANVTLSANAPTCGGNIAAYRRDNGRYVIYKGSDRQVHQVRKIMI